MTSGKLIITNGDSAARLIAEAGLAKADNILPWQDVLHEGPVPESEDFEALCAIRCDYLVAREYGERATIEKNFRQRCERLRRHHQFDRIEIWLEHDLYDQLQLLQILDYFAMEGRLDGLVLVQADDYLAGQTTQNISEFRYLAAPVTMQQLEIARDIWTAFRKPTPEKFAALSATYIPLLPFMQQAMQRMLQELPTPAQGLGRVMANILKNIGDSPGITIGQLFGKISRMEDARFLGDVSFFKLLEQLQLCENSAIEGIGKTWQASFDDQQLQNYLAQVPQLTAFGTAICKGKQRFCDENRVNFWWGGSHLTPENMWYWDGTDISQ